MKGEKKLKARAQNIGSGKCGEEMKERQSMKKIAGLMAQARLTLKN